MVGFEAKVKELCRINGKTQKELYATIGMSDPGMRKMYARNSCEVSLLEKIAEYFSIPVTDFFCDEKEKSIEHNENNNDNNNISVRKDNLNVISEETLIRLSKRELVNIVQQLMDLHSAQTSMYQMLIQQNETMIKNGHERFNNITKIISNHV